MKLAGILFDKDGTLVDFEATWGRATRAVMRRLAGTDPARARRLAAVMHLDEATGRFGVASPLLGGTMPDLYAALSGAVDRADDPSIVPELNEAFAEETLASLMPIGDPGAVLAALRRQGLQLGLATNDGEANARQHLARLGLDAHLEFVAGYDSGHGGKPEPGMVLAFAAQLGVPPDRVALVGDTPHDLNAARAAGAVGIAVLTGPTGRSVLEPLADHVIASVAELPALIGRLG